MMPIVSPHSHQFQTKRPPGKIRTAFLFGSVCMKASSQPIAIVGIAKTAIPTDITLPDV
jgi:hypothetical protein